MIKWKSIAAIAVMTVLAASPAVEAGKRSDRAVEDSVITASATLNHEEADMLVFMREEEKLARDVYRVLYEQWNKPIFTNISASEQRHMDAVLGRIEFYHLTDPVIDDSTGAFVDTHLAEAYLTLTDWGMKSLQDGLMVGAYIEELDILDLEEAIELSRHEDCDSVYEELMRGSRNHLRAFVGELEAMGVVYEAQLMEQEDVDTIVDSPMERG